MSEIIANYIGGAWSAPISDVWIPNENPADRRDIIGNYPNSDAADAELALEAASAALPGWSGTTAAARGDLLRRVADVIESQVDDFARDLMRENGKSLPEAKGETMRGVAILRYYAQIATLPDGDTIPSLTKGTLLFSRRSPIGVVTLITPWNFPIAIPLWKAAPALAYGNTVILKPSELAPHTALRIARAFEAAGAPAGVFNVVFGGGARVGETLTGNPMVSGISFTGSSKVGKHIAAWAASRGKKYQLEMGGKNGVVVLADANLEQAANLTIQGAFKSAGQKCTATSRVIVERAIFEEFRDLVVTKTKALKTGPGSDPSAYLGPVISQASQERILNGIATAQEQGAVLLTGGASPDPELAHGFYVLPAILDAVSTNMRIWREELFGPTLCLMAADNPDHALTLLNDAEFGLSAAIFTRDLNRALEFADKAQAGMVRVNAETAGVEYQAPFGGMKASSSWSREQGLAARDFYTQVKTVSIDPAA